MDIRELYAQKRQDIGRRLDAHESDNYVITMAYPQPPLSFRTPAASIPFNDVLARAQFRRRYGPNNHSWIEGSDDQTKGNWVPLEIIS